MNSNVHPLVAALVLVLTFVAIGVWMWGTDEAASVGGPAELQLDPDGHLYVQIQNKLVEHDADGEYVQTHDLSILDVEQFLGSFAFFSNGDVLLRRGPDPRSFGDNVRAYRRETNERSLQPLTTDSGLFRCDLDTSMCTRFGESGIDFKAAHSIFIDWQTDAVYISDTTRHVVRMFSADGSAMAEPLSGYKFPNQLMSIDDQLIVADTNNHVVRIVDARLLTFGDDIGVKRVVPPNARTAQQTWPSHFARVGNEWWVNNMRTGMNEGGLYIFDNNWLFARRARLPSNADPISLLEFRGDVLVSDWNNDLVRRLSSSGEPLPHFESAGLESIFTTSRATRARFKLISYSGIALFAFVLGGMLVRAFAVGMTTDSATRTSQGSENLLAFDTPLLLQPNSKTIRRNAIAMRLSVLLLLTMFAVLLFMISTLPNRVIVGELVLPAMSLVVVHALIAWASRANTGTAVRVDKETVTLRDHAGRESSCRIQDVRYDKTNIATHDMVVFLGIPATSIYDRNTLEKDLFPRLVGAQKLSAWQMQKILFELRHPQGVVTALAIAALLFYAIWRFLAT